MLVLRQTKVYIKTWNALGIQNRKFCKFFSNCNIRRTAEQNGCCAAPIKKAKVKRFCLFGSPIGSQGQARDLVCTELRMLRSCRTNLQICPAFHGESSPRVRRVNYLATLTCTMSLNTPAAVGYGFSSVIVAKTLPLMSV